MSDGIKHEDAPHIMEEIMYTSYYFTELIVK